MIHRLFCRHDWIEHYRTGKQEEKEIYVAQYTGFNCDKCQKRKKHRLKL